MVHNLSSWNKFIEIVRDGLARRLEGGGTTVPDQVLYRGHAKPDWKLSAPLDRRLVRHVIGDGGKVEYESLRKHNGLEWYDKICLQVLNRFKHGYRGIAGPNSNLTDYEYWAID